MALGSTSFMLVAMLVFAPRFGTGPVQGWGGGELQALETEAEHRAGVLWLDPAGPGVRWVITAGEVAIEAAGHDFVWLHIQGLHPATQVRLFWRNDAEPRTFHSVPVDATVGGRAVLSPAGHEGWTGTVIELGVLVSGSVPETLGVGSLRAGPLTARSFWPTVLTQWATFRPWRQATINHLAVVPRGLLFPIVPAVALWIVLVLLSYRLLRRSRPRGDPGWILLVFLIGWVLLDLRWQADLMFKLDETRFVHAGKTVDEKYLAGPDAGLYQLSMVLRESLYDPGSRVFVLSQEPKEVRRYKRRRMHYFLLPANVYSRDELPPLPDRLRGGDLILALAPHEGLRFEPAQGELTWGDAHRVSVTPVYQGTAGTAWRVVMETDQ